MIIKKKVKHEYFELVNDGRKRFEIRLADFGVKPGDTLILQEQDAKTNELTGRELSCEILHQFNTKDVEKFYSKKDIEKYGLMVMAIRRKYDHNE